MKKVLLSKTLSTGDILSTVNKYRIVNNTRPYGILLYEVKCVDPVIRFWRISGSDDIFGINLNDDTGIDPDKIMNVQRKSPREWATVNYSRRNDEILPAQVDLLEALYQKLVTIDPYYIRK